MELLRRALALLLSAVLSAALVCSTRPCGAAEPPLVLVAPARGTPEARRAAHDLAVALGAVARAEEVDVISDPHAAMARGGARAVLVVDVARDAFLLTAFGLDGRSWAPRPVARQGADAVVSEHVATAGRSIVAAVLAVSTEGPSPGTPGGAVSPGAPAPVATPSGAASPEPSTSEKAIVAKPPDPPSDARVDPPATPHDSPPASVGLSSSPGDADVRARIDAGVASSNVGSALPIHAGAAAGVWWLRGPLHFGAAYAFYPGAVVDGAEASLLLTRHTVAIGARAEARFGRWEIAGTAGPIAEIWLRSTRAVTTTAAAAPSSTHVTAGAFVRAGLTFWAFSRVGLDGGLGLELSPASPHFRGPSGADVLSPNVARARADLGLTAGFR